jgi:hypothetical protein
MVSRPDPCPNVGFGRPFEIHPLGCIKRAPKNNPAFVKTNTHTPQLESLLPGVTWQRSLHETLAATADAMRVKAVSMGIPTKSTKPSKPVILARRTSSSSSRPTSITNHTTAAIVPAVTALEDGIDDATMRAGILTSREVGVGMITAELKFLEASPSLCSMLLGIDAENDGTALCGMSLATIIHAEDVEPMLRGLDYISNATFGQ